MAPVQGYPLTPPPRSVTKYHIILFNIIDTYKCVVRGMYQLSML